MTAEALRGCPGRQPGSLTLSTLLLVMTGCLIYKQNLMILHKRRQKQTVNHVLIL